MAPSVTFMLSSWFPNVTPMTNDNGNQTTHQRYNTCNKSWKLCQPWASGNTYNTHSGIIQRHLIAEQIVPSLETHECHETIDETHELSLHIMSTYVNFPN